MSTVRLATRADCRAIVDLMETSQPDGVLDLTIYACHGVANFLEAQLSLPRQLDDMRYVVTEEGGQVYGFVEMRLSDPEIFVNYICIAHAWRGRGTGDNLLLRALQLVQVDRHRRVSLDVFEDNIIASTWYEKRGFQFQSRVEWWKVPLRENHSVAACVSDYPQALACQERFGFSRFTLNTGSGHYIVGLLGTRWFRTGSVELLRDADALGALALLDPGRKILAILPYGEPVAPACDGIRLRTARRLSADIDDLFKRISTRKQQQ